MPAVVKWRAIDVSGGGRAPVFFYSFPPLRGTPPNLRGELQGGDVQVMVLRSAIHCPGQGKVAIVAQRTSLR